MFTFPALIIAGVPAISANATNNGAMWLGTLGSTRGYREEIGKYRHALTPSLVISLIGGFLGAILLLRTPQSIFERLVPWLLLFAMVVFIASPYLPRGARATNEGASHVHAPWQLVLQFFVALYGGYFGAGIGYLMLALLAFSGLPNIHAMNGVKNLLAACINGVALIPFIAAGVVDWRYGIPMAVTAVIGGYVGSRIGQRLPPRIVRGFVIVAGCSMTAFFFWKG
jgi:uncharacterized membrane protein YfcA